MLRQHRPFWPSVVLIFGPILAAIALSQLPACASTNAVAAAQTLDQKAYAVYGTFVILEEQSARIAGDPGVSAAVKSAIRAADAKAKPSADTLVTMLHQYDTAVAALKSSNGTAAQLTTATANLTTWIDQATTDVNALVSAVKGTAP